MGNCCQQCAASMLRCCAWQRQAPPHARTPPPLPPSHFHSTRQVTTASKGGGWGRGGGAPTKERGARGDSRGGGGLNPLATSVHRGFLLWCANPAIATAHARAHQDAAHGGRRPGRSMFAEWQGASRAGPAMGMRPWPGCLRTPLTGAIACCDPRTTRLGLQLLAVSLLDATVKVFYLDTLKFFLSLYGHKVCEYKRTLVLFFFGWGRANGGSAHGVVRALCWSVAPVGAGSGRNSCRYCRWTFRRTAHCW